MWTGFDERVTDLFMRPQLFENEKGTETPDSRSQYEEGTETPDSRSQYEK